MLFHITYNSHVIELSGIRMIRSSTWLPLKTWHLNGKAEQKNSGRMKGKAIKLLKMLESKKQ